MCEREQRCELSLALLAGKSELGLLSNNGMVKEERVVKVHYEIWSELNNFFDLHSFIIL